MPASSPNVERGIQLRQITPSAVARRLRSAIRRPLDDAEVERLMAEVDAAYVDILERHLDDVGAEHYRHLIAERRLHPDDLQDILRASPEYLLNRSGFYHRLHASRAAWCAELPAWNTILDIGGSSPTHELGALLELGYAHHPAQLDILDRPEDDQFHGHPTYDQRVVRTQDWGTVTFHHGDAGHLEQVPELDQRRFDAVFMGQVIEHIPTGELPRMLEQIRSHLVPNGSFVFDTPNRALTKVVMGDEFLTNDHTKEYEPSELAEIVRHHGFVVEKITGIHPMPVSLSTGRFDPYEQPDRSDSVVAEDCFCFAIHCHVE